jgi:hypothetical protein
VLDRFLSVGFVEQHNVSPRPPDVDSERSKGGVGMNNLQRSESRSVGQGGCSYLVVAIEIKIFFRLQCIRIGLFWCRLYTFSHVR